MNIAVSKNLKNAANNDIVVLDVANYLRFFAASESKEVFITDMDQENKLTIRK